MEKLPSLCIFLAFLVHFLTLCFINAEVTDISTDKQALLALKSRIIYDPSNLLANNWSTSSSVCDWIGITCGARHLRVTALNISHFGLTGTLPPQLGNLSFLATLDISNNSFYGSFPEELALLRRLKYLDFGYNKLSGELPASIFNNLPNLQVLYLYENMFHGILPSTLSKWKNLQFLSLLSNHFSGAIPKEIGNLTRLEGMDLGLNKFQGAIPKEIGNMTLLKTIIVGANKLQGGIPYEVGNLHNLEYLNLEFNNLVGPVPATVFNISTMEELAVTRNDLTEILPLNAELPSLWGLYLADNNFSGPFPGFITNTSKLVNLEMSVNSFSGIIPSAIGNLRNLEYLGLSANYFTSSTPDLSLISPLTNCKYLKHLLLYSNPLNSILPSSIGNLSISLEGLLMDECNISGNIPKEINNLNSLIDLHLEGNELTGSIPVTLSGLQKLQGLTLQHNKLEGFIPNSLCHLNELVVLRLDGNKIYGSIPACLGNLTTLRELWLGFNKLTSFIPSTLWNLKDILYFNLSSKSLNGSLPLGIGNLKVAINIDLSRNLFSGHIPTVIGSLENLQNLSLAFNKLQGSIPKTFGHLRSLEFLDLSNNNLSGLIPNSLEALFYLKYLNLSFNQLSGEIPKGGSFGNFSIESFMGNLALCGSSRLHVPLCKTSTHGKSSSRKVILLIVLPLIIIFTLVVFVLIFVLMKCRKKRTRPRTHVEMYPQRTWRKISYHELVRATNGFNENNLLGRGSYGSVFRGRLRDGMELAVKVEHDVDVASTLEYLHFGYSVPIVHCDLKPSNILLDENMVAHLSDFGIAKLLGEGGSMTQRHTLATIGYMAPEYGREGKVSRKGDVYSYGIMLMETFTRKKPTDEIFTEAMSLRSWVGESLCNTVMQVLDTNLLSRDDEHFSSKEECVSSILSLAMECTRESPLERMSIKEVATRLIKIRVEFANNETRRGRRVLNRNG